MFSRYNTYPRYRAATEDKMDRIHLVTNGAHSVFTDTELAGPQLEHPVSLLSYLIDHILEENIFGTENTCETMNRIDPQVHLKAP